MRMLFVVALLLCASPALAGRAMVVKPSASTPTAADELAASWFHRVYDALGIDFDVIPQSALNTLELRNARYEETDGSLRQYDYIIWENYRSGGGAASGAAPDSLQRGAGWPAVPYMLITPPSIPSTNILNIGSGIDSNGFAANPARQTSYQNRVEYVIGNTGRAWHQAGGSPRFTLGTAPPGVLRPLLGESVTAWTAYQALGRAVSDWDSLAESTTDTVTVAVRYRADSDGNGTGTPIVIVVAGATTSGFHGTLRRLVCGLAVMDSAGGGTLLFQTRSGPVTFTPQLMRMGGSGGYRAAVGTGYTNDNGIFIPAGVDSDSVAVKATLTAFQTASIKGSVGVQMNTDSTGSGAPYRRQLEWVRDLWPLAKVFPYELAGLDGLGGNSSITKPLDAFGYKRLRSLLPNPTDDPRDGCDSCRVDTTSVLCTLIRQRKAAEAFFGQERVDKVWAAPGEDWTPTYFGRATGDIDSLVWVFHLAGLRGIRIGNMGLGNIGASTETGAPRGWFRTQRLYPVRDPDSGQRIGTFAFIPSRDTESETNTILQTVSAHDNATEFLAGLLTGSWYEEPSPIYVNNHEFFSRPGIFEVTGSWLGGNGSAQNNWRPGYWFLDDFDEFCDQVNQLAGRTVIQMSYGEDTARWMESSKLGR